MHLAIEAHQRTIEIANLTYASTDEDLPTLNNCYVGAMSVYNAPLTPDK